VVAGGCVAQKCKQRIKRHNAVFIRNRKLKSNGKKQKKRELFNTMGEQTSIERTTLQYIIENEK